MKSLRETIAEIAKHSAPTFAVELPQMWQPNVAGLQDDGTDSFEISLWYASQYPQDSTGYDSIPKDWTWADLAEIISGGKRDKNWQECRDSCIENILKEFAERVQCTFDSIYSVWEKYCK